MNIHLKRLRMGAVGVGIVFGMAAGIVAAIIAAFHYPKIAVPIIVLGLLYFLGWMGE